MTSRRVSRATLIRVAALGAAEIARRARAGTLDPEARVLALRGAETFLAAIAHGDIASEERYAARLAQCGACPSRVDETAPGASAPSSWCGRALKPGHDPPTCGCCLLVACLVGSKTCPQRRWKEDT